MRKQRDTAAIKAALRARFGDAVKIGEDCVLPRDLRVELDVAGGATLIIGNDVAFDDGTLLQALGHGQLVFGDHIRSGRQAFYAAMRSIRIEDGVGIANDVDIRDHNHVARTATNSDVSMVGANETGFEAAPIVIKRNATISNRVQVLAGSVIGQNSIVGSQTVVGGAVPPNVVVAGSPLRELRSLDAPLAIDTSPLTLNLAFIGTSITEHRRGFSQRLTSSGPMPAIGDLFAVDGFRSEGHVARLQNALQRQFPWVTFTVENFGVGGATSRDLLQNIRQLHASHPSYDLVFYESGINDVWRGMQPGRETEAVGENEYRENFSSSLDLLRNMARTVIVVGQTPVGPALTDPDPVAMNREIARYNDIAHQVSAEHGVAFLDTWQTFAKVERERVVRGSSPSAWDFDGVHMNTFGSELLFHTLYQHLAADDDGMLLKRLLRPALTPVTVERTAPVVEFRAMEAFGDLGTFSL